MLYRYATSKELEIKTGGELPFADAGDVQDYAVEAMEWMCAEGLINGIDGKLDPSGSAIRAQIATILMRFCEAFGL